MMEGMDGFVLTKRQNGENVECTNSTKIFFKG